MVSDRSIAAVYTHRGAHMSLEVSISTWFQFCRFAGDFEIWAKSGIPVSRFAVDFTATVNQKIRFTGLPGILTIFEKPDIRFAGFQGVSDWALKSHTLGPPRL